MGASLVVLASIHELFPCSYAKILDAWPFLLGFEVTRERERENKILTLLTLVHNGLFQEKTRNEALKYGTPDPECNVIPA